MRKANPSKIVINPRPPAVTDNETNVQDPVCAPKSVAPPAPPAPPAPGEEPKPAPKKEPVIDQKKLPKKPIPKK